MNRLLTAVLIVLISLNVWYAWYQQQNAYPQNTILDQDLAQLDGDIAKTEAEMKQYKGGLIRTLVEARLAILNTSRAMLDQKRHSLLRGIDISYTIEGQPWTPATEAQLKDIGEALGTQQAKVKIAEIKADTSGGLIGVMARVEAQVERMTEAMLQQRALAAKFGLPYAPVAAEEAKKQKEALGTIVADPDAL